MRLRDRLKGVTYSGTTLVHGINSTKCIIQNAGREGGGAGLAGLFNCWIGLPPAGHPVASADSQPGQP